MQQGLGLIELLIVLAVTGILAAIAYPSYSDSLQRAARSEVIGMLHDAAQRLERQQVLSGQYTDSDEHRTLLPLGTSYYRLQARRDAEHFTLLAMRLPHRLMADDRCGDFQLEHTGARSNPNSQGDDQRCWGS